MSEILDELERLHETKEATVPYKPVDFMNLERAVRKALPALIRVARAAEELRQAEGDSSRTLAEWGLWGALQELQDVGGVE